MSGTQTPPAATLTPLERVQAAATAFAVAQAATDVAQAVAQAAMNASRQAVLTRDAASAEYNLAVAALLDSEKAKL
jgi:hypothetical protein